MRHLIIGTAGHVDHGKTALVKALTNIDCDTHREEKERGITINLGFSHLDLPTGEAIGIVDVPGHKDFIRTMVAGAYGIDIALVVVAADSGIMPQTQEHLRILEMLGVEKGIVALTKSDLVDDETLELAELEISEYLDRTSLKGATVIPVSSITGQGLKELVDKIAGIVPEVKEKVTGDNFRMYIDRIFNVKGLGYVVTGSVLEGRVHTGDDLYLLPGNAKKVKVRNIERHGVPVKTAYQGDRAALNLAGLKIEDYSRGMVLSNKAIEGSTLVDATIKIFDPMATTAVWTNVLFISGTFETGARMHLLDKDLLGHGETGLVQLHLDKPAVLSVKDKFIIRNSSNDTSLGGGTIIDVHPLHHRKRTGKLIQSLNDLVEATLHSQSVENLVKIELNKINGPAFLSEIASILGKPAASLVDEINSSKTTKIHVHNTGGDIILISSERAKELQEEIIREFKAYHNKYPILEEGLEVNELAGKFGVGKNEAGKLYFGILVDKMSAEGLLQRSGPGWALADHKAMIDPKAREEMNWLEDLFRNSGMDIPNTRVIEEKIHSRSITKDRFKMLLRRLTYDGKLVYYEGIYLHRTIVLKVEKKLLSVLAAKEDGINEKEFRELINGTRKFIQVVLGIFISAGLVIKPTFYILITNKGRETIENHDLN
jgi:selenocysteine-specific elongation factor